MGLLSFSTVMLCLCDARTGVETRLSHSLQAYLDTLTTRFPRVAVQLSYKTSEFHLTLASGNVPALGGALRPATIQDTWLFGSATKAMTAAMIMRAQEEGRLHINDTVSSHLDLMFNNSIGTTFQELFGPNTKQLTIWHLMSMQAGIPDFDMPDEDKIVLLKARSSTSPLDFVLYAASQPWVCAPGACISYSSTNYILLGYVLLAASGAARCDDWQDLDQSSLDGRLGGKIFFANGTRMNETGLTVRGKENEVIVYDQPGGVLGWTCGNAITTTTAMADFYWDLLVARTVVSAASLITMQNTHGITTGWQAGHLNYGAGLFVQQTTDEDISSEPSPVYGMWGTTIGHGGATYGFQSDQGYIPQLNATWSYAGNDDSGSWTDGLSCSVISIAARETLGMDPGLSCQPAGDAAAEAVLPVLVAFV